jgi:plastocyanin
VARRPGLVTILAAVALAATASACSLPQAPARVARTNADAAHGKPYPTLAPKQAGAPTIEVVAKAEPKFEKTEYEVPAGVVNISFSSPVNGNHNFNLVGPGAPYPLLWGQDAGSGEDHLTHAVTLQTGTYEFYCSVQGHRAAGMHGTIKVS